LLRYPKINLIATGLSIAMLLTLSAMAVVVVPTLTTPVMAAPTAAAPVPVLPAPLPSPKKLKALVSQTVGFASWYGSVLEGHHTASGERFKKDELTAAHRTLPFGTLVRVVDVNTGNSVIVRINDRGVLFPDRVIDLSSAAARSLGILREGVAKVRLEVLKKTPATDVKEASTEVTPIASAKSL
jgi:rare lipoprotein A